MTRRRQWILVAALAAIAGGAAWLGVLFFGDEFKQVTVGSHAPRFSAVTLDSAPRTRTLADYKGQVMLVNIWATWCPPCEREMPVLQGIYQQYRDKGLKLVAVSTDAPGMEGAIRGFVKKYGLTFDVLYDPAARIMQDYMTPAQPESFIIGRDGVIRFKQVAAITDRDAVQIRALLDQLLAERAN